jgi:hypothetical protein
MNMWCYGKEGLLRAREAFLHVWMFSIHIEWIKVGYQRERERVRESEEKIIYRICDEGEGIIILNILCCS